MMIAEASAAAHARDFAAVDPADAVARRLQVALDEQRRVVQERRQQRGERHLAVGHLQEVRHDEGHRAHHRRHHLRAVGGAGLDRRGKARRNARLLHERDGDHADGERARRRDARDAAEETRRDHRNLGGAAAISPHQTEREVVEESRAAGAREELAHQHEGHHDGAGDLEHEAEQAVVVEAEIDRERFRLDLVRLQLPGDEMPDEHPHHQDEGDDDQRVPRSAARPLQRQEGEHRSEEQQFEGNRSGLGRQAGESHRHIQADGEAGGGEQPVVPRDLARGAARRGKADEEKRQAHTVDCGEELLRKEHQARSAGEADAVGEGAEREQRRERDLGEAAGGGSRRRRGR